MASQQSNTSGSPVRIYVEPVLVGQESPELIEMDAKVNSYVSQYPSVFSGTYISTDSSGLTVGVVDQNDPAADALKALVGKLDPTSSFITIIPARYTWNDLDKIRSSIVDEYMTGGSGVSGVGVDASQDAVLVEVPRDASGLDLTNNPIAIKLTQQYGSAVMFQESAGETSATTANNDISPHFGGSGYKWYDAAGSVASGYCSLGFPVKVNNVTYGLTAGHCRPGSATNYVNAYSVGGVSSSLYFGSLYTTTWIGTQNTYGDWSLLKGSGYNPYVYNGPVGSSTFLSVVDASFYYPSVNSGMCSSGARTGQICRYKVFQTGWCEPYDGVTTCSLIRMKSDQNNDGSYDCDGWYYGDSGGSIYAGATGGVRAFGIASAITTECPAAGRFYYATSLFGVSRWNSGASMPLAP